MRKLLILGAGIYQVPLIRKAKEMGLETHVVSRAGEYPGFLIADRIVELDTTDYESVLDYAQKANIDGIVTTGTDVAVKTIGYVCDKMHLNGISFESALHVTDKARMKDAFSGKVSTAAYRIVKTFAELEEAAGEIGYPIMVKACDVSGSRGITKVTCDKELQKAFGDAQSVTHTDHYVAEKFIEGVEIGVDAFVENGEMKICLPHNKFVYRSNNVTVPLGHSFPFAGDEELTKKVNDEMQKAIQAANLNNCAVNGDFMITADGEVYVLEIGGRCGATCIPELINRYTGIDYYKEMIKVALGEKGDFSITKHQPCMAKLLHSDVTGIIRSIDSDLIASLRNEKNEIVIDYAEGDQVQKMHNGTHRIGHAILETDNVEELDVLVDQVQRAIHIQEGR